MERSHSLGPLRPTNAGASRDVKLLELDDLEPQSAKPPKPGLLQSMFQRTRSTPKVGTSGRRYRRPIAIRRFWLWLRVSSHYLLLSLGALYTALILRSTISAIFPDGIDWMAVKATSTGAFDGSDIFPIACHSHNDYWRARPLFTALEYGCSAIESDVWLSDDDAVLVGHTASSLSVDRTLSSMYLNPILEILDHANPQAEEVARYDRHSTAPGHTKMLSGVFDTAPKTTLVLLIDFKSDGHSLWTAIYSQLEPLRRKGYLTYFNGTSINEGPVTVVVSGNAPFENVVENHHYRDMFYDAPLDLMPSVAGAQQDIKFPDDQTASAAPLSYMDHPIYNTSNSFYASVSFKSSIGYPLRSKLTRAQIALMRAQIRGAHSLGLKVRYWGVPPWPIGVRNYLWRVMVREGVDFLSVDDVRALAKDNWGPRKGGWGRKWWF